MNIPRTMFLMRATKIIALFVFAPFLNECLLGGFRVHGMPRVNLLQSTIPNYTSNSSWNRLVRQRVYAHCLKENGTINSFQENGILLEIARNMGINGKESLKFFNSQEFVNASYALEKQLGGCLKIAETPRQLQERGIPYEKFLQSRGISMKQENEERVTDLAYCSKGQEYNYTNKKSFLEQMKYAYLNEPSQKFSYREREELYYSMLARMKKICPYVW